MKYKIGVFGSAVGSTKSVEKLASELGKEIAINDCELLTGGCGGLPQIAAKSAYRMGGKTIGYSPAHNLKEHTEVHDFPTEGYSEFVFVPEETPNSNNKFFSRKYRNVISCFDCDAGIIVGGRIGTLNEFTNLYDMEKIIGVLQSSNGITDLIPLIVKTSNKKTGAIIVYDKYPKLLVNKLLKKLGEKNELS
ncbi:MAG: hypothetical protein ABIJ34_08590 [archaeon]